MNPLALKLFTVVVEMLAPLESGTVAHLVETVVVEQMAAVSRLVADFGIAPKAS